MTEMTDVLVPGVLGPDGEPMTLGVMGGGQLGRMFVHAAQAMGFRTAVLDPDAGSPAGSVSHHHIQTPYLDATGLAELARMAGAITTEFENVPAQALAQLAALGGGRCVAPSAQSVAICQDRSVEKAQLQTCGVACAPYAVIAAEADLAAVSGELLPGILKTSRLGYDGLGQIRVDNRAALASAWQRLGRVPCVIEKRLDLERELSVIVARDAQGQVVHFSVQQNHHRDGILAVTIAPAPDLPPALAAQAIEATRRIAASMAYVGVLCVEFFVLADGSLVANEMAPRPHNSGHYTIDACDVSQFDLQVRAMAGLPLVAPRQHSAAVMLNLLGDLWFAQGPDAQTPPWPAVLALPGAHLHLYGKQPARPGRKMGHLTLTAATPAAAMAAARQAAALLHLPVP